jgi:hypothetical protein
MIGSGGAAGQQSSGGGGDTHIHYAPQVSAYGAGGLSEMLQDHSTVIHGIVKAGMRKGALPSV